jgi:hypothetical protein
VRWRRRRESNPRDIPAISKDASPNSSSIARRAVDGDLVRLFLVEQIDELALPAVTVLVAAAELSGDWLIESC